MVCNRTRFLNCVLFAVLAFYTLALAGRAEPGRSSEKTAVQSPSQKFPTFLSRNFDYAAFTRFESEALPKDGLVQSNGFLALMESAFGKQMLLLPAPVEEGLRSFARQR